jgi:hypothetical protein
MDKAVWYATMAILTIGMLLMSLMWDLEISPEYIRGKYGMYCYVVWHVPKNVKNYTKYRNLKECEKSLLLDIEKNDW